MDSHSERASTIPSGSPLPSLRTPPTRMRSTDCHGIPPGHRTKRVKILAHGKGRIKTCNSYTTTIYILPNELLLDIFDHIRLSRTDFERDRNTVWKWHVLVHICRRWRQIVFASPIRLDLQLLCTNGTPVRKRLDCWPAFPVIVDYDTFRRLTRKDEDNILAALEKRDRICQIKVMVSMSFWIKLATVMREPFPALTSLSVSASRPRDGPFLIPDGFLGGSTPRLREIRFQGFPSPTIRNLASVLHTNDLVELELIDCDAHVTGCISLAGLIVCLAMLPRLKILSIVVDLMLPSRTEWWQMFLTDKTRAVLPALKSFSYEGGCAYLEDLVARVETPALDSIHIAFLDPHDYQIPHLSEFLNRTAVKPSEFKIAHLSLDRCDTGTITLDPGLGRPPFTIDVLLCDGINHQLGCVAQVLRQTPALLSKVTLLEIDAGSREEKDEDLDDVFWPELFNPFTAVWTLHVLADSEFAQSIARVLEDTSVLPALDDVHFTGVGEPIAIPGRDCNIYGD